MLLSIALSALLGVLAWSLLEYSIHRWLGHDPRFRPNVFAKEHVRHHAEGNYFAPTSRKLLAAAVALLVIGLPAVLLAGLAHGGAFTIGLVSFYLFYEVLHRREHTHAGINAYGRWARRHHFWHHFGNPKKNHGVTSPIWDFVFRTYQRPGIIAVPEKLRMAWLCVEGSNELRPELEGSYRIRRRA